MEQHNDQCKSSSRTDTSCSHVQNEIRRRTKIKNRYKPHGPCGQQWEGWRVKNTVNAVKKGLGELARQVNTK